MARNSRRSRGMKKLEPAVQTLSYNVPVAAGATVDVVIDISQSASLVNRRFYRQGLNWAVSGLKILTDSTTGVSPNAEVLVEKLPETWIMSNSWEKGFRAWQKMNDEALAETESVKPRFLDFKIYANSNHHAAGYGANLLPLTVAGVAVPGEWEPSKFVIPDTSLGATGGVQEREVIATGANYPGAGASGLNAVSLIEGYAASRALPSVSDPNTPDDANDADGVSPENWLQATFNEGTQQDADVLDTMAGIAAENNIAPYPFENDGVNLDTMYPGGANQLSGLQVHDIELITGTTIGGTTRIKGGMFPCGLMALRIINNDSQNAIACSMLLDLVPGTHRGYLATPMTEM